MCGRVVAQNSKIKHLFNFFAILQYYIFDRKIAQDYLKLGIFSNFSTQL